MNLAQRLREDYLSFATNGLPSPLESYIRETYRLDLSSHYGRIPVKNPFGKASGQLSLAVSQVERDAQAGLGFCVLKTVVSQDAAGSQSMHAWAIPETRMLVERIHGKHVDEDGWTVTWKGRGWSESFERYLIFMRDAVRVGDAANMLVVPSCTFHLPADPDIPWREEEYAFTINALLDAWNAAGRTDAMPIEKDFSPTLAGSDLAKHRETILNWVQRVPELMRRAAGDRPMHIGMKIFNTLFDEDFQTQLLAAALTTDSATDYVIYGNRLFDPEKIFEGKKGVAYGGPDLSWYNLRILDAVRGRSIVDRRSSIVDGRLPVNPRPSTLDPRPLSATGNITTGATAIEYLQRGCSTFQIHTFFQLPDDQYSMTRGTKVERAMHELLFHPEHGFIAGVFPLREKFSWGEEWSVGRMGEYFSRL